MAQGVYYLQLGPNRRIAVSIWMVLFLVLILILTIVGLVLAAVALAKAAKSSKNPPATPTPSLPPPESFEGYVEDGRFSWNDSLKNKDSQYYIEVSHNITQTLNDALVSRYPPSNFKTDVSVTNLTKGATKLYSFVAVTSDASAATVLAAFRIVLTPLNGDAKPTDANQVQSSIQAYAKKNHIDIHTHVQGATTPGTSTSTKATTRTMPKGTTTPMGTSSSTATATATTSTTSEKPTTTLPLPPDYYAASKYLTAAMNFSEKPCDNFFDFVCGNWIASHPIGKREADIMVFTEVQQMAFNITERALNNVSLSGDVPVSVKKTKNAYTTCMDLSNRDQTLEKVASFSEGIESDSDLPLFHKNWNPVDYNLARLLGKLINCHGSRGILGPMVDADVGGDIKKNVLYINQGSLIRGSPTFYLNATFSNSTEAQVKSAIRNITLVVAGQKNISEADFDQPLTTFVDKVYALEVALANITLTPDELRNHTEQYNPFNVSALDGRFPLSNGFSWTDFVKFILIPGKVVCPQTQVPFTSLPETDASHMKVVIGQESYLHGLRHVFSKFSKKDIFNYLFVRMFMDYASDIPESNLFSPDRNCVGTLVNLLPWTTGRLYVQESGFSDTDRSKTSEMVGELQTTLGNTMKSIDFFDESTRASAVEKVDDIVKNPGFPDWIMNGTALDDFYNKLEIGTGLPWINVYQQLIHFSFFSQIEMLSKPSDRKNFLMSPAVVNAWYDPEYNSISFPVAILQAPFFRPNGPMSLNFGGIGAVIGHELTHGFDDEGVQYNGDGQLHPWVDRAAERGFRRMADCIVNEYSNFCPPELNGTVCLNGVENQGENIADNGGIRQSFNAYLSWLQHNHEHSIPGFENYTHEQMFFIGYASFWCGTESNQYEVLQILTNPHSPARYRVLGTLGNLQEFSDAFQCSAGDRYDPKDKCYVWANNPNATTIAPSTTTTEAPASTTSPLPPDYYAASKYLKAAMNISEKPCDNFFNFVCGNWIASHPIEKGEADVMVFTEVQQMAFNITERALINVSLSGDVPVSVKKTKNAYTTCMDLSNRDQTLEKVASFSEGIESDSDLPLFHKNWNPVDYNLARLLGKLINCHGSRGILGPMVDADVGGDIKKNVLYINQGSLIRGSPTFYLNATFSNSTEAQVKSAIRNITLVVAGQKNISEADFDQPLKTFVDKVYALEVALANITLTPDELRNHTEQYNPFNVSALGGRFPLSNGFSWTDFVKFILIPGKVVCPQTQDPFTSLPETDASQMKVVIGQESYLHGLRHVFSKFSKKDIFNYLFVRMFMDYASDIPESNLFSPDRNCVGTLVNLLPWTTGRLYVQESGFSDTDRSKTSEMVGELQTALGNTMKSIDFFDESTRASAVEKVDDIVKNPGFPDWIMNGTALDDFYNKLEIGTGLPWINVYQQLIHFSFFSQIEMLSEPSDRKNFLMSPAVVNAWYDPEYNSISFPVAILQAPFFRPNGPMSLNFGGIGAVIGHELTHGFDDEGVQYNGDGQLHPWVDRAAERGFRRMADCIVNEYSSFCPPELNGTVCLNGVENQGENIADNGGIRQSFNAYLSWLQHNHEHRIPGFENYTHEQMFFIGYASFWCGTESNQYELLQILTNPHSPARYRVQGTLGNLQEFADAFSCSPGDKYDRENKCYVWANQAKTTTASTTAATTEAVRTTEGSTTKPASTSASTSASSKTVQSTTTGVPTTTNSPTTTERPFPPGWYSAAMFFSDTLQNSTSPCDSFYNYSCGSWAGSFSVERAAKFEAFNGTAASLLRRELSIDALKPLKLAMQNCESAPHDVSHFLAALVDKVGGLPAFEKPENRSSQSLEKTIALALGVGVDVLVAIEPATDVMHDSSLTVSIQQPFELTLGPPEFYDVNKNAVDNLNNSLGFFLVQFARASGLDVSDPDVYERLQNATSSYIDLEKKLIYLSTRQIDTSALADFNSMSLSDFNSTSVDWKNLVNLSVPRSYPGIGKTVVVPDPIYLKKLSQLVNQTTEYDLRNYIVLRTVMRYRMSEEARKAAGKQDRQLAYCLMEANTQIPALTGRAAMDHFSPDIDRVSFSNLSSYLANAVEQSVKRYVYFDNKTKDQALSKISKISSVVGFPGWVANNSQMNEMFKGLSVNASQPWPHNLLDISIFGRKSKFVAFNKIGQIGRRLPSLFGTEVLYWPTKNSIFVPLILIRPPFFHADGPMFFNFGSLGSRAATAIVKSIASEIGLAFNSRNIYSQWATPDSRKQFLENSQSCISDQYSSYTLPSGEHLNGAFELDNNLASTGALKIAHTAYVAWAAENPAEPLLPGYPKLSQVDAFFAAAASTHCAGETEAATAEVINAVVPVAPPQFLVDGVAKDSAGFASNFNCTVPKACHVLVNPTIDNSSKAEAAVKNIRSFQSSEFSRCSDPYVAACGNFKPVNQTGSVTDLMYKQNLEHLANTIQDSILQSGFAEVTRNFFAQCTQATDTSALVADIKAAIAENGGWPMVDNVSRTETAGDILALTGTMERKYGLRTLLSSAFKPRPINPANVIMHVDQGTLGMGSRALYLGMFPEAVDGYKAQIKRTAQWYYNGTFTTTNVDDIYKFEHQLATEFTSALDRQNFTSRAHFVRRGLGEYFRSLGFSTTPHFIAENYNYLENVKNIISNAGPRTARNYIMWRFALAHAWLFDENLKRPVECARFISSSVPDVVAAIVQNATKHDFAEVTGMVESIRETFVTMINSSLYMNDGSKTKALDKLRAIAVFVGFPKVNLTELQEQFADWDIRKSFLKTAYNLEYVKSNATMEHAMEIKPELTFSVVEPVVHFDYQLNSIAIPAGAIHEPLYGMGWPSSVTYGGLGYQIGRAFASAFSPVGLQFDGKGKLSANGMGWLWDGDNAGKRMYEEQLDFIRDNYSMVVLKDGSKLNGTNFEATAFSDWIGLELAYEGFKKTTSERVAGVAHMTPRQLFFASFGSSLCSHDTIEQLDLQADGVVAPASARVGMGAQLSDAYQQNFACVEKQFIL